MESDSNITASEMLKRLRDEIYFTTDPQIANNCQETFAHIFHQITALRLFLENSPTDVTEALRELREHQGELKGLPAED